MNRITTLIVIGLGVAFAALISIWGCAGSRIGDAESRARRLEFESMEARAEAEIHRKARERAEGEMAVFHARNLELDADVVRLTREANQDPSVDTAVHPVDFVLPPETPVAVSNLTHALAIAYDGAKAELGACATGLQAAHQEIASMARALDAEDRAHDETKAALKGEKRRGWIRSGAAGVLMLLLGLLL